MNERHRGWRAGLALLGVLALAGCAVLEGPTPEIPERPSPEPPQVAPKYVPGGTAEDNLPYFTEVIRAYAQSEQPILGEPLVNAVRDAGFSAADMQVSFDQTKTGLLADNIFVSVRFGEACLIGQVVTSDRSFVATDAAAVGPADDICLIGTTRSIDW